MPHDPQDVQELFLRLVELPPADRPAALDRECGSDVALRQRIEGLLKAHEESDSLLDRPSDRFDATVLSEADNGANLEAAEDVAGDRLPSGGSKRSCSPGTAETHIREESIAGAVIADRYTMVQQIGEGGMGEVWMAKQTSPVKRKVALKLIKMGMDSKAVLARFDQERQALALMDHPNIAKVLDGGITPTGQPFFVMELVNGLPLNKFCDEARLDTNGRLELFVSICQAIQHAHQKGIVHRDLKPANILVTLIDGRPVPKVIDFGVAKATSGKLTDGSLSTQFGAVVGTLEYMSPEQAGFSGEDIDTRADIYSLGVILYELLTGLRPIDAQRLKKAALTEMIRIVREEEPSRPSTRLSTNASLPSMAALRQTDPKKLMALLRGELDWVVMKCLEKQRERRYETANALARDVQRYLADEPVEARRPSAGYRLKKFFKRNRAPVIAASLILVAVVAGIFGTAIGLIRADQARRREAVEATARATAEKARDEVAAAREQLARVEYGRTIEAAHQEWRDNNVAAARTLLGSTRPDLRGWEWRYVHRLCHSDLVTIGGPSNKTPALFPAFSPNGTQVVTYGANIGDTTATVWNAMSGDKVFTLKGHTELVGSASFSPDGSRIVTASWDKTAKVWDARTGAEIVTLTGHTEKVDQVCFSADGLRVATGSQDNSARVWDVRTGTALLELKGFGTQGYGTYGCGISFSPDGAWIVFGGADLRTAKVWNAKTGAEAHTLKGHTNYLESVSFSPDGTRIVTASADSTVKVWDAKTGAEVVTLQGHNDRITSASFNPDSTRIVTASYDKTAKVWDAITGAEVVTLQGHNDRITSASFSPDGARIVTGSYDKTARVWDAQTGFQLRTFKGHVAPVSLASFSPDGTRIVTCGSRIDNQGNDHSVKVWDANSDAEVFTFNARVLSPLAAFSRDGKRIVTHSGNAEPTNTTARVWEANTGAEILTLKGHTGLIASASFNPDGTRIVTASQDKTAKVWDAITGAEVVTLQGHNDGITSASFSPDGTRIVTGSYDKTARVWDVKTGEEVHTLKGHTNILLPFFSPDGTRIVTASGLDGMVKVCDAKTGAEVFVLRGHVGHVMSASFSPDGSRIVSAGWDKTAKVWDAQTGIQVLTLKGHNGLLLSASFSPDGSRIITTTTDGSVKIWDATPINHEFLTRDERRR